ncbi:hypothetical protein [Crassaminicella profunda]|uniref:hypothetical protein n=1 Tax=Crassaminicella profunda TaxID=1286698 RepID=UPI001CA6B8E4|nr:hypothetical protein [Crassaminicella profunda]QZY56856.1 hypothetical protein K7H06_08035 [Crassaminicella profunda]
MTNFNIQKPDPVIGTPEEDSEFFPGQQSFQDTCAIRCQQFIIEQFTGGDIPEESLVIEAQEKGWYTPGEGTSLRDVGNLLEAHGITVNRYDNANIFHLANELIQGHKVIIGVDSGELWNGGSLQEYAEDFFGIDGADHAITVLGIDTSNQDNIKVIIGDPGTGEASAKYPLEQFMDAWKDSGFYMVATQNPVPHWLPETQNFNYDLGCIDQMESYTFDEINYLAQHPEEWEEHFSSLENYYQNINEEESMNAFVDDLNEDNDCDIYFDDIDEDIELDDEEYLDNDNDDDYDEANVDNSMELNREIDIVVDLNDS